MPIACYFVTSHSNLLVVAWKPVGVAADLLLGSLPSSPLGWGSSRP